MEDFLRLIELYGVIPLFIFIVHRLWKLYKTEKEISSERLAEMLGSDVEDRVERTKLIENNLALMEKYIEYFTGVKKEIHELSKSNEELKREIKELKDKITPRL